MRRFKMKMRRETAVDTVYHYCSLEVFQEIIEKKKLRMTDIVKTNDKKEVKYCYESLSEILYSINLRLKKWGIDNNAVLSFFDTFPYNDFPKEILMRSQLSWFVTCFSLDGDLLSQWRGYAEDGQGVAIGFNSEVFLNQSEKLKYVQVNYNINEIKELLVEKAKSRLLAINSCAPNVTLAECENIVDSLSDYLLRYAVCYKHPSFQEERETRLIYYPFNIDRVFTADKFTSWGINENPYFDRMYENIYAHNMGQLERTKIDYYLKNNRLVPYFDIDFSKLSADAIKKIILGPKNRSEMRDVQMFMLKNGFDISRISFEISQAPYD